MKKTNILEMSAHPVYLDEPVADESELVMRIQEGEEAKKREETVGAVIARATRESKRRREAEARVVEIEGELMKARREAEINGLKEALSILENETAFMQRRKRSPPMPAVD